MNLLDMASLTPAIQAGAAHGIFYFFTDKFVDDLALRIAREMYRLEKLERQEQTAANPYGIH